MLTFDAERHAYAWNNAPVPSVTQVIRSALGNPFEHINAEVLDRKRQIGIAAHRACELDDRGDLVEESVHVAVRPYLEAWRKFREQWSCQIVESEKRYYNPAHGYAGTPDVFARLGPDTIATIDLKTGLPGPHAAIQTAAYQHLCPYPAVYHRRFALRAMPTGEYRLIEYKDPGDWRDFLACLVVHRLKEKHG